MWVGYRGGMGWSPPWLSLGGTGYTPDKLPGHHWASETAPFYSTHSWHLWVIYKWIYKGVTVLVLCMYSWGPFHGPSILGLSRSCPVLKSFCTSHLNFQKSVLINAALSCVFNGFACERTWGLEAEFNPLSADSYWPVREQVLSCYYCSAEKYPFINLLRTLCLDFSEQYSD